MRFLSNEQPPVDTPAPLKEWLMRLVRRVDDGLRQDNIREILYTEPEKPAEGQWAYFGDAVADTEITEKGLWGFNGTEWEKLNLGFSAIGCR